MQWACHITTYRRPEVLAATIRATLAQTRPPSTLLVVDNGGDAGPVVEAFGDDRLVHVATGENLGSAGGCAFGLQWLYDRGFEWMLLIDDDNPPVTADAIERVQALAERHADDPSVGGVGATGQRWNWSTGEYARLLDSDLNGDIDVDIVGGNNLMTVRRATIDRVGTPDPALFFGFWDPLYCLRIRQAGFRLLVDGDLMYEWRRELSRLDLESSRSLVPRDPASGLWRRYYVTRNYIYRMRHTFGRPDLARRMATRAAAKSVTAFARGPRFGARYASFSARGIVDGYRGRLGRNVEPQAKTSKEG